MSEKSTEIFISHMIEPPELDSDEDELEGNYNLAVYESSKYEIISDCGKEQFKYTWLTLKDDVKNTSIKRQRIFAEQMLDKISEIYDFIFSETITLDIQSELNDFYDFLEFLEYDNSRFLSYVWKFLNPKNIIKLDVEKYCNNNNKNKIIKEINEQLEMNQQSTLIILFLKSFYKDNLIEWFIKNSNQNFNDIIVKLIY